VICPAPRALEDSVRRRRLVGVVVRLLNFTVRPPARASRSSSTCCSLRTTRSRRSSIFTIPFEST
jgi:hypothetical protein